MNRRAFVRTALGTALMSLGACAGGGAAGNSTVELADLPALEQALAERRGKSLLVNLWAVW
jgi:hypothetical protein